MTTRLSILIDSLSELSKAIEAAKLPAGNFNKTYGWNQVPIHSVDITHAISNLESKLIDYGSNDLTEHVEDCVDRYAKNIDHLTTIVKTHYTANQGHLLHLVPSIMLTLTTISSDIEFELFSWEDLQDKKLIPRKLTNRLRGLNITIEGLESKSEALDSQVKAINDAHEAADNLPVALSDLKEAQEEFREEIEASKKELEKEKGEIEKIKNDIQGFHTNADNNVNKISSLKAEMKGYSEDAKGVIKQCNEALNIATTEGLAAGFDQKAKELRGSIWIWIVGLLIALSVGGWVGAERVDAFTAALNTTLSAGQAILHTVMAVFSLAGPLWLAWISTQQINQRFKLSEDYSYKATVAKSFTGFRKFANEFDHSTQERLFNSTLDRLDEMPLRLVEGKDYNSPWHEFMDSESFQKAIDLIPGLAKEVGRFASSTKLKAKPKKTKETKAHSTEARPEKEEQE